MKALKIIDVVEAIETRPEDWWIAVGFKDHKKAMRYLLFKSNRISRNKVNKLDRTIVFDWLVKHGDIDEDEATANILNGCYWFDAVKYLKRGIMNIMSGK